MHALAPRLTPRRVDPALRRPGAAPAVPGIDDGQTVNGGVTGPRPHARGRARADPRERASIPGIVGDSPDWADKPPAVLDAVRARTPIGRLVTMDEIVDAAIFLLENGAVNGVNLDVDGGWLLT